MTDLQKGLVGHWTMDDADTNGGTLYDRSAYDNHGMLEGVNDPPITSESGIISESYRFIGESDSVSNPDGDRVRIPSSPDFDTTSFTACGWVYVPSDSNNDGDEIVLINDFSPGFWLETETAYISDSSITYPINITSNPPRDTWYHIATTYDGTTHKIYYNGVEENQQSQTTPGSIETELDIGAWYNQSNFHDGSLDDVRFYNRALSANEVRALYNMRSQRQQTSDLQKGLVGHWTMDDADTSGGTLYDSTANNNHGNLVNSPTTGQTGQINESYSFTQGNNEEVQTDVIPSAVNMDGSKPKTICAWFYPISENEGGVEFGSSGTTGEEFSIRRNNSGYYQAQLWSSPDVTGSTIGIDQWVHVAVTYDGTDVSIYYNGSFENSESHPDSVNTVDQDGLDIGVWNSNHFDGRIDDVRIYNRALSENELSRIANKR